VPTATVVSSEFWHLAQAETRSRGLANLPLVKVPHPVGTIGLDALNAIADSVVDKITASLVQGVGSGDEGGTSPGSEAPAILLSNDGEELFREFSARGWTDGLPILPPTRAAVAQMVAAAKRASDDVVAILPPLKGVATIEKLGANAVMAGCRPEYFPLIVAAVRAMTQPGYNLDGVQTTTGNVAPLAIVNGPCRQRLAVNFGANALGQGWRANATIGRALRLIMTNIGGARPGLLDKSTLGQPAKYAFCFGENEAENPWQPLHVEKGLEASADAVSMFGCSGVYSAVDMASQTAKGLLKTFALTMTGGLASGVTSTEVMFIVCPEHAAIFAQDGFSKAALRDELFSLARVPFEMFSDENLELLSKRRPAWFEPGAGRAIGAVDKPQDIWFVVAGGAGGKSAYIPGRTATRLQTIEVD
jgi:hypothetical protein